MQSIYLADAFVRSDLQGVFGAASCDLLICSQMLSHKCSPTKHLGYSKQLFSTLSPL